MSFNLSAYRNISPQPGLRPFMVHSTSTVAAKNLLANMDATCSSKITAIAKHMRDTVAHANKPGRTMASTLQNGLVLVTCIDKKHKHVMKQLILTQAEYDAQKPQR